MNTCPLLLSRTSLVLILLSLFAPTTGGAWESRDVGGVGAPGSHSVSGSTFTIRGSGADIWNRADEFHYVHRTLTGDGEIHARVSGLTPTDDWAKAGVMFRASLEAGAPHAHMLMSGARGAAFQYRLQAGGSTRGDAGTTVPFPRWVRLVRKGNVVTAYHSADGSRWVQRGTPQTIALPPTAFVGIAVTSHRDGLLATATVDSVQVLGSTTVTPTPVTSPEPVTGTAPAWVGNIAPGTWAPVSLNRLVDVDPAKDPSLNPNYPRSAPWRGNSGQGAVIGAWNGGALASGYGSHGALLVFGGGHAAYYGSEVYAFDLGTRYWKRVSRPYTGSIDFPYASTAYPDGSPVPPHTYDYVDYHPGTNSFVLMRGLSDGAAGTNDTSISIAHLLDLDTGQWRRSRRNGTLRLYSGGISCYDRNRDAFWLMGPSATTNAFTRFDPKPVNSDGTVGAYTNYTPGNLGIDGAADCDPVNDLFVYTLFRYYDRVYARSLTRPNEARVVLNQAGDPPAKRGAHGWAWSDKRQGFIYWRQGAGVYEFKHTDGDWDTGTWRWRNLTAAANAVTPPDMSTDNGIYSRFRIARWGTTEVGLVVNGVDKAVHAFRIPE